MKNLRFFDSHQDYEEFVFTDVFRTDVFRTHFFYRRLINWVLVNRTPVWFDYSDASEHAHFTQYFGLFLRRNYYENPVIHDLYVLHDMVHNLFEYPMYPRSMPFEKFANLAIDHEYVASNETEIMVYLRVPGLRERTFPKPILYDLLCDHWYDAFNPQSLLALRRSLASSASHWALFNKDNGARDIQKYMSRVSANWVWSALWYDQVPYVYTRPAWADKALYLTHDNYVSVLSEYDGALDQETYERNLTSNASMWARLTLGTEGRYGMDDIPLLFEKMDGKIMLPEAARIFAQMYPVPVDVVEKEEA